MVSTRTPSLYFFLVPLMTQAQPWDIEVVDKYLLIVILGRTHSNEEL
jgi:hypothetical protein